MLTRELIHKLHLYKSKGGKVSRKRNVERMKEFIGWCNCPPHQTGRKYVHEFFAEKKFAPSTARDYWYAIRTLWELMGRIGEPPKPPNLSSPKLGIDITKAPHTNPNSHFNDSERPTQYE